MAQEIINYGATANDGTGDPLRTAFIKTDNNFDQIWAAGPVGSNITVLNNTISVTNTNGNLILSPNGTGIIQTNRNLVPRTTATYDLGSANTRYRVVYADTINATGITVSGNISTSNVISTNDVITLDATVSDILTGNIINSNFLSVGANIAASWRFNGEFLTAPSGARWHSIVAAKDEYITTAPNGFMNLQALKPNGLPASEVHLEQNIASINVYNGGLVSWVFTEDGNLSAPGNVNISGIVKTTVYNITTIPGADVVGAGARAFVTDADNNVFGNAYVGGSGNSMPVFSDGTSWYIG